MAEKIHCQWATCRHQFGTRLDMGLHVLTNHLDILEYGHFVLENSIKSASEGPSAPKKARIEAPRRVGRPRRSGENSEVISISEIAPESSSSSMSENHHDSPDSIEIPAVVTTVDRQRTRFVSNNKAQLQESQLAEHIATVRVAENMLSRLRMRPPGHVFFGTQYYCLPCLDTRTSPCLLEHSAAEFRVSKDLRIRLRPFQPNVTVADATGEMRRLVVDYKQDMARFQQSIEATPVQMSPKIEPFRRMEPSHLQNLRILSSINPNRHTFVTSTIYGAAYANGVGSDGHATRSKQSEGREEPKQEDVSTGQLAIAQAPPPIIKKTYNKMSKLCQGLINQLRGRNSAQFRASDRSHFCLTCLSFKKCFKTHDDPWTDLERMWREEYGHEHIVPDELICQLEAMKQKFLAEEGAAADSPLNNSQSSQNSQSSA